MIRRITFGNLLTWLPDLIYRHSDYGHIVDRQSQKIADLIIENGRLQMQLTSTQNELTQTKEDYEFYFIAYRQELLRDKAKR